MQGVRFTRENSQGLLFMVLCVVLIFVSLIPISIEFFQLAVNGGLGWHMRWANEARFWSAVFGIFPLVAIVRSFSFRTNRPKYFFIIVISAILCLISSIYSFSQGFGKSSKGDVDELQLIQFWYSNWWV